MRLSSIQLGLIMPKLSHELAAAYLPHLNRACEEFHINRRLRLCAFLAQVAHESNQLRNWVELADGRAYDGRKALGNTQPGDGPRFRGRGPLQLTGRANYRACGEALGLELEKHPELLELPEHGFRSAAWFWHSRALNPLADADYFLLITRRINGGLTHLDRRLVFYERAKTAIPEPHLPKGTP